MAILIPTFLKLCRCGRHGHFVLPDGTRSEEFCSREAAREELETLRESGRVTEEEVVFLRSSVNNAEGLAVSDEKASFLAHLACHLASEEADAEEDPDDTPQHTVH